MELIRISDRKLKIMLTPADMIQFEFNAERLGEDSEQMRRSFRLLMREVRRKIGFDMDDRKISVQYFPSREGGCEMFVSSLPGNSEKKERPAQDQKPTLPVRPTGRQAGTFRRDGAYRFDSLEKLLQVCSRLRAIGYIGESAAFRDEKKRYYLLLNTLSASPFSVPEELCFLVEYGDVENAAMTKIYLREHAALLCRNAVEHLGRLV